MKSQVATLTVALLLCLFSAEGVFRALGYRPWRTREQSAHPVYEPDNIHGWRNRPGKHLFASVEPSGPNVHETYWPDNSRATRETPEHGGSKLLFFGCSFTQGFGISDNETYPWLIQQRFPDLNVLNYGTGGFGTYQSLLLAQRVLQQAEESVTLVVYGLIELHEERNVYNPKWVRLLAANSSNENTSAPYCELGSSATLACHSMSTYPYLPLREYSALVNTFDQAYAILTSIGPNQDKRAVTQALIEKWRSSIEDKGQAFLVVLLDLSESVRSDYREFFTKQKIEFLDCINPDWPNSELTIPGEGHPNKTMNLFWADCLERGIRKKRM
jgi:hypothetical protein